MEYQWNTKKIRNQLEHLRNELKLNNTQDFNNIKDSIYCLESLLDNEKLNLKTTEKFNINLDEYANIIIDASNLINSKKYIELGFKNINKSENEVLTLVHDFFSTLTPKIYTLFLKVFKEKNNNVYFSGPDQKPQMFHIPYLSYSYLYLRKTDDVREEMNTVHEYSHCVSDLLDSSKTSSYLKRLILEVPSLFMELISSDYFKHIGGCSIEYTIYEKKIFDTITLYMDSIYNTVLSQKENYFIPKTREFMLISDLASTPFEYYMYSFSYLVAIELYYIYKEDPEKALNLLEQVINLPDDSQMLENLDNLGITPTQNIERYERKLVRKFKKSEYIHSNDEM